MASLNTPQLYPAQRDGVARYLASGGAAPSGLSGFTPRRFLLSWKTGCGKTGAALTAMRESKARTTLIVCPAIVRNHWLNEIDKWLGPLAAAEFAIIEWGRKRKLSKKPHEARAMAYASHNQIVSYELLHEIDPYRWGMIIFDEIHHLAYPLSRQSKVAESVIECSPHADILGLSATLIPTEVAQLWNPLRLLFGTAEWGGASRTKDISWDFIFKYCNVSRNEYGTSYSGLNQSNVHSLRHRLKQVTHELSRNDIIADLPPLDVGILQLPSDHDLTHQLVEWHNGLEDDVCKRVILVKHRILAQELYAALLLNVYPGSGRCVSYVDGSMLPVARHMMLQTAQAQDRVTLVATYDSLREGIRILWAEQVAIAEWPTSPGPMTQLLGRFNSIGSNARPQVTIMCHGDTYGAAQTLLGRTHDVMATLGSAENEQALVELLDTQQTQDIGVAEWLHMFNTQTSDTWKDEPSETERP